MGFSQAEHSLVALLYVSVGVIGIILNFLMLVTLVREKSVFKYSRVSLHVGLAASNIGIVACSPFAAFSSLHGRWLFGEFGCQLYAFEGMLAGIAAIGFVFAFCIECALVTSGFQTEIPSSFYWTVSSVVILNALFWSILPLMGWARYVFEPALTTCALNWKNGDTGYPSYIILLTTLGFGVPFTAALLSLWFSAGATPTQADNQQPKTEYPLSLKVDQLRTIGYIFLLLVIVGWGPFAVVAMWPVFRDPGEISTLASCIPPLTCKCMTWVYPLVYTCSNQKLRKSFFSSIALGSPQSPKKD